MTGKISALVAVLFLCLSLQVAAQVKSPNPVLTADSLATGNYKDVLNSFFQLAFDQLTSPDKSIRFTGTPFAVMAKLDTTLLVDTSYIKYRTLRNLNYMFALRLDTSFRFNGFSSGIKYAIINKRDETVSRTFVNTVLAKKAVKQLFALNNQMMAKITTMPDPGNAILEYTAFRKGNINFGDLSKPLQDSMLAYAAGSDTTKALFQVLSSNSSFNIKQTADSLYQDMRSNFNNNTLWTVGVTDTTYENQFIFSNVVFHTEFLKGLNKYANTKNDLEFNAKAALQLVDDTLNAGRDLKRAVFSIEPALNLVLKTRTTKKSYFELKVSTAYYRNFSTLYAGEERDRFFLNGTIRLRILNDIWVPVEIKYDPKNGNLFGFLNVRANFTALAGAVKQLY